ncbi:MAG: glucuronate isomerase [Ruminococcus sp.]|uniref:glucuronate isomerase n=1 Tax=Ruminococcus sp. TaxID=41978 RepID=UPI0025E2831D|nr:glucuronate isomerase [Ruminococcus sp.]MCR5542387.1 glucuronate isomerase [Ruminococcus sp.]
MDNTKRRFMDKDFLLDTEEARILFHKYAEDMPIIDYHCHIDPKDIAEDRNFDSITELWLGGDHYKWRAMRQCGIAEKYITGKEDSRERFRLWCRTLSQAVGSPLYHWSHLELQKYFDCTLPICEKNADEIFDQCNAKLQSGELSAKKIIGMSKVKVVGTTDDPCDDLKWHKIIAEDKELGCKVIPTFRPDKVLLIEDSGFADYIRALGEASGCDVNSFGELKNALTQRIDYFAEMGCRSSDQSTVMFPCTRISEAECERIFRKGMANEAVTEEERLGFITEVMLFLGKEYRRRDWVMQLHFGVARNSNSRMFEAVGRDTGFDRIHSDAPIESLAAFLDELDKTDSLPKTVLYSLDPSMNTALDVLAKCFNEEGVCGKVQHGAAWWFNDNLGGMKDHLRSLCEQGVLGSFIGMLTDSRCMLSYTRHEYFRRILCAFIGRLCADGELYWDEENLGEIVKNVSFNNAMKFFGME